MRLRNRHKMTSPEIMIIPMIDIMFFLLVFFMLSTLYMVDLRTVEVNMPRISNANAQTNVNYLVTMRADGSLYLENHPISQTELVEKAQEMSKDNPNFAVVIRADEDIDYGQLMMLLDKFKAVGITKFGLATEGLENTPMPTNP